MEVDFGLCKLGIYGEMDFPANDDIGRTLFICFFNFIFFLFLFSNDRCLKDLIILLYL